MHDQSIGFNSTFLHFRIHLEVLCLQALGRAEAEQPSYAYMAGMAVKEKYRREGVGTTLLTAAEMIAKDWGREEQVLHVYADNVSAIEFYTRNGYNGIRFESDIFTILGKRSRITMWKHL